VPSIYVVVIVPVGPETVRVMVSWAGFPELPPPQPDKTIVNDIQKTIHIIVFLIFVFSLKGIVALTL
jgi:hypothetical protein